MSKGSTQRPGDKLKFDTSYERIFRQSLETSCANNDILPCPFCGSSNLISGSWYIDDAEVPAWECCYCKAGAPQGAWSKRFKK